MDLNATPRLAPGCRLHPSQDVLLVPEGALALQGPAKEILAMLDGKQTVASIVEQLHKQYPGAGKPELQTDVVSLLERMEQRGVVRI